MAKRGSFGIMPTKRKADTALTGEEKSLFGKLGSAAWNTFTVFGETVDTPQQIIRSTIMWLKTGDQERWDDALKAMIPFRRKFGVEEEELPSWEDVLAETFDMDEGWQRTGAALGIGITGDLLFMPSLFTLTKKGDDARKAVGLLKEAFKSGDKSRIRAAQKILEETGELAGSWAEQAAQGQRAALRWPILSKLTGKEWNVAGEGAVEGVAKVGQKVHNWLGLPSKETKTVMEGVSAAEAAGEFEMQQQLSNAKATRFALATLGLNSADEVINADELAGFSDGIAALMQPVKTNGYVAGISYGVTNAGDDFATTHVSWVNGIIKSVKSGTITPEKATELLEPIATMAARSVRYGTDDVFAGVIKTAHSELWADSLGKALEMPVYTARQASKMDISGKHFIMASNVVGEEITSKTGVGKVVKLFEKKGAQITQAGIAYNPKGYTKAVMNSPRLLMNYADMEVFNELYKYKNELVSLNDIRKGVGEDVVMQVAAMQEDPARFAKIMGRPAEELNTAEKIAAGFWKTNREQLLAEQALGSPIVDHAANSMTEYALHALTPTGKKIMNNPGEWTKYLQAAAERTSGGLDAMKNDLFRRSSLFGAAYTPWKKMPSHLKESLKMFVGDDQALMKMIQANGVSSEVANTFSSLGWHWSMESRNPILADLSVIELNDIAKSLFGVEDMWISDPWVRQAIRNGRHHKFMAGAKALHEAAESFGTLVSEVPISEIAGRVGLDSAKLEASVTKAGFSSLDEAVSAFGISSKAGKEGVISKGLAKLSKDNLKKIKVLSDGVKKSPGVGNWIDVPKGYGSVQVLNDMRARLGQQAVVMPEEIASAMNRHFDFATDAFSANKFYKGYMGVLRWWKGWQLFNFPGYYLRNMGTDIYRGTIWAGQRMDDLPANYGKGADILSGKIGKLITNTGAEVDYELIRDGIGKIRQSHGATTGAMVDAVAKATDPAHPKGVLKSMKDIWQGYKDKLGNAFAKTPTKAERAKNVLKLIFDPVGNPWGYTTKEMASNWEMSIKMSVVVDQIQKGSSTEAAVKHAMKWLIDYGDLSQWERTYATAVIPFYTWMRHNIPLTVESIFEKPYVYDVLMRSQEATSDLWGDELEQAALPAYIQGGVHFRLPTKPGEVPQYLVSIGMPEEDVFRLVNFSNGYAEPLRRIMSSMAPMPKILIEVATGKNLFFDKPISEMTRAHSYIQYLPEDVKDFIGYYEYETSLGQKRMVMNPWWMYALSQMRIFTEMHRGADERKSIAQRIMNISTGARVATIEIEREVRRRIRDEQDRVLKDAEARGLVRRYGSYYKSKGVGKLPDPVEEALKTYK